MQNKIQYKSINKELSLKINTFIDNNFQQAAIGTLDCDQLPFVSKVIPMLFDRQIFLLLSDLSEHTRNININSNVSIYFAGAENHRTRSNNPRLTLQGKLIKLPLKKNEELFKILLAKYMRIDRGASVWAKFDDFNFYKFEERRKLFVQGFGKAFEEFSN